MPDSVPRTDEPVARVIRVFISSTFRDMQEERDELAKRIFPQLRKLCESRGVTFGGLDLRWGITDEQKAEGKVLPICLAEIQHCRPYFIGLLGERYGWVPDEIPPALIAREPWLAEHLGHSVTELEILHGVLRNPQMAEHVFFYFRSSSDLNSLPTEQQPVYREVPSEEEIEKLGAEEAHRRAEDRKQKLARLKERIRESGLPVRENYPDPRALGERVLADLTAVINRVFPEGSQPGPLDREAAEHEIFARSRCVVEVRPGEKVGVYIGRREYTDQLDAHAAGGGPPLVVLGESGLGKSALIANWAMRYRDAHPGELLLMHFIGATPASADWAAMVRRILGEFNRRFELKIEIPDKPDALRAAFANALYMAATKGRVILILDALNQLEDRDQAPDLVWLPPVLPAGVRLIISTLPGRPLDGLRKRGWPTLQVEPLNPEERKQLVVEHLAQSVHSLDPAHVQEIASAPQTANPLYLRALLEELMLWGEHLTLGKRIAHYLSAPTLPDLYQKILERYEEDYERDRPGLVRDAFSLISAARSGLSESELLDMLGADGGRLPQAIWAPLSLAAERSLLTRSGLIGFSHSHFRQAIQHKYLAIEEEQHTAHARIADYFDKQTITYRKVDELPWQLLQVKSWDRLASALTDLPFLDAAYERDEIQVAIYWQHIEAHSSIKRTTAYSFVLESKEKYADFLFSVSGVFVAGSYYQEALALVEAMVHVAERQGDNESHLSALYEQVRILKAVGQPGVALSVSQRGVEVSRQSGNLAKLFEWLGTQGDLLLFFGVIEPLRDVLSEQKRVADKLGDLSHINIALNNQSVLLRQTGELDRSLELEKQIEQNARTLGNSDHLIRTKAAQATILWSKGQIDDALALIEEQERILRIGGQIQDYGFLEPIAESKTGMLRQKGLFREALDVWKDCGRDFELIGNRGGEAVAWDKQALIYKNLGDYAIASSLHQQAERVFRDLGMRTYLGNCLVNDAILLFEQLDKPTEARDKTEEAIGIFTEAHADKHLRNAEKLLEAIEHKRVGDAVAYKHRPNVFLKQGNGETKAERRSRKRPWWRVW